MKSKQIVVKTRAIVRIWGEGVTLLNLVKGEYIVLMKCKRPVFFL